MRLILFILVICVTCMGQATGSLELVIRDPSGALIHKAVVQLIKNGKIQSTTQTNQRGATRFTKLAPGPYQLHIEAPGFKASDLDVDVNGLIMLRDEIDYAEFRRRAVAARLARLGHRPNVPEVVIGQPASTERQQQTHSRE